MSCTVQYMLVFSTSVEVASKWHLVKSFYCHTRLHLGFSAKLGIWQISICKMEPRSGINLRIVTHHPTKTHPILHNFGEKKNCDAIPFSNTPHHQVLGSVEKLFNPLGGREGSPKRTQNISGVEAGSPKDHRGSRSQRGGCKNMAKLNNYSQDQLCSYPPIKSFWPLPPKKFGKHAISPKIWEL